jgi:hypothetical protein
MASRISTYFKPKISSVFSGWKPELSDQSVDDWYKENMPWLATEEHRKAISGLSMPWNEPDYGDMGGTSPFATDTGAIPLLDYHPTQGTKPTRELFTGGAEQPGMTKEQEELYKELSERQKDAAKAGFFEGVKEGATAGSSGGALGAAIGAVSGGFRGLATSGYDEYEPFAQEKILGERKEEQAGYASDAARLAAESAAAEQRLGLPTTGGLTDQQALAQSYSAPNTYDDWYESIFSV